MTQPSLPLVPPGLEVVAHGPVRVLQITAHIRRARDRALSRVASAAGSTFTMRARQRILQELETSGCASGEALVVACRQAGVHPACDDRAFGPVFKGLLRDNLITVVDTCQRARGHGSAGGRIYARTSTPAPQPKEPIR